MYQPFTAKREAIISCRLHTTLMSILAGNRKIIQFQIEQGTSKIREIFDDLGLTGFRVHPVNSMRLETIMSFLHKGDTLTDSQVANALLKANGLIETGLGALENWLDGVG